MKKMGKKLLVVILMAVMLVVNVIQAAAADGNLDAKIREVANARQYYAYKLSKIMTDTELHMNSVVVDSDYFDEKTVVGAWGVGSFQDTATALKGSKAYEESYYRKVMAECVLPVVVTSEESIDLTLVSFVDALVYEDTKNYLKDISVDNAYIDGMDFSHNMFAVGSGFIEGASEAGVLLSKMSNCSAAHLEALKLVRDYAEENKSLNDAAAFVIDASNSSSFENAYENYLKLFEKEMANVLIDAGLSAITLGGTDVVGGLAEILTGDSYNEEMNELFYLNFQNEIYSTYHQFTQKYPNALKSKYSVEEIQDLTNLVLLYLRCGQLGFAVNFPENAEACTEAYQQVLSLEFPYQEEWPEESSNDVVAISDYNVPNDISEGDYWVIYGTINSEEVIEKVIVDVKGNNGHISATAKDVGDYKFDVAKLDSQMTFDSLAPGEYTYTVTVETANDTYKVLQSDFNVKAEDGEMIIVKYRLPHNMNVGDVFYVTGTVKSKTKMSSVSVEIVDENGNFMTGGTADGNYKSFDLKQLDKYVEFNKLSSGTYRYVIKATNAYGEEVLVDQSYLVQ